MRNRADAVIVGFVLVLFAMPAHAETRVHVNIGLPAICVDACGGCPCDCCVWIDGCCRHHGPRCAWRPGYWRPAGPHRPAYAPRSRLNVHESSTYIYNYNNSGRYPVRPGSDGGLNVRPGSYAPYGRSGYGHDGGAGAHGQGQWKAKGASGRRW
jgi:hypothetical protein